MNIEQTTDAQLMSDLANGRADALAELIRRHQTRTLALAYRMLGRWDQAEDIAQECFLRVYRQAGRYQPDALFTTWLYRIVVNLCTDARRRRKWSAVPLPDDLPADAPDRLEQRERADRIRRAVDELPDRQRTAVILHRYQELSHRQVAEATGWSESAVESLLVRAYEHLRGRLGGLQ